MLVTVAEIVSLFESTHSVQVHTLVQRNQRLQNNSLLPTITVGEFYISIFALQKSNTILSVFSSQK